MNLKERAKKLKTDIPTIFLALKDKETPLVAKLFGDKNSETGEVTWQKT